MARSASSPCPFEEASCTQRREHGQKKKKIRALRRTWVGYRSSSIFRFASRTRISSTGDNPEMRSPDILSAAHHVLID